MFGIYHRMRFRCALGKKAEPHNMCSPVLTFINSFSC